MKLHRSIYITALLATAMAATVHGQEAKPPRQAFGTGELPEFLKPYDLDNDGKLSVEERQAFEQAVREAGPLKRPDRKNPWDTNEDGKLSEEEKEAARAAVAQKVGDIRSKRFAELDADKDGLLTVAELGAIPAVNAERITRMVEHLDDDKDGKISLAEFNAALKPLPSIIPPLPKLQIFGGERLRVEPILATFDTDKNGWLSFVELAGIITTLDTSKNGMVSYDEWKAFVLAHPEILPPGRGHDPRDGEGPEGPEGPGGPGRPGGR